MRLALATLLLVCACDADELTEIVVVVDSDLEVPEDLDELRIVVDATAIGGGTETAGGMLTSPASFPQHLGIVHSGQGGLGPITVTATGLLGGIPVVERRARVSFVRGRTVVLRLDLVAACVGRECAAEQTCAAGVCRPVDVVESELHDWNGRVDRLDAGAPMDGDLPPDSMAGDACLAAEETCNGADDDCDGRVDESFDLMTDEAHCGACGNACPGDLPHASAECRAGGCAMVCDELWGDCDGTAETGCETPLNTRSDCGACETPCTLPNASSGCILGFCQVAFCSMGWDDCDGMAENGCEAALDTNATCGSCTRMCSLPGAVSSCVGAMCTVASCAAGYGDCDGLNGNGCEADLLTPADCGGCGLACMLPNATPRCDAGGICAIAACSAGWGDCDGLAENGCETPLTTLTDCGACGMGCTVDRATATCATGTCAVGACAPGFADCNAMVGDGCEVDLSATTSCGACGVVCSGSTPRCGTVGGGARRCVASCGGSTPTLCGESCVDTVTDPTHCGGCGIVCTRANAAPACVMSACRTGTCVAGYGDCDGMDATGCESPLNTLVHCGACGSACARANATASCASGGCQIGMCAAGWGDCDGIDATGCERSLDTLAHCGGCGIACARDHATATCAGGSCAIAACEALFGNCDGVDDNGCETALRSLTSCGACGRGCDLANASESCSTGSCELAACDEGWGDCDGTAGNGCETPLSTLTDCGGCGTPCARASATETCATGACRIDTCDPMRGDCDGMDANGCETDLAVSSTHCGTCGRSCGAGFECRAGSCYDLRTVVQVDAGTGFTCARRANGQVACWGDNSDRQLGSGTPVASSNTPVPVMGLTDAIHIATGRAHACAVRATGGVVCWGLNTTGQLGDGSMASRPTPVAVTGVTGAVEVAAGDDHTCARLAGGQVWCWGDNMTGELGDGSTTSRATAAAVRGLGDAVEIAAGNDFSCARRMTGAISCWGRNDDGQIGDGSGDQRNMPVAVSGISDARDLAIGRDHTCVARIGGAVMCWGRGASGRLGDGSTNDRFSPVMVAAIADARAVGLGDVHSCAIRASSAVVCWGENGSGQIGDGTLSDRSTPVMVSSLGDALLVDGGASHTCALRSTNQVVCWGSNFTGELGDGTTTPHATPAPVIGL